MGRRVSDRRRTRGDDEGGYTFIELIISIVLLTMITGAVGAAFVTAMNGSRATRDNVNQSNDAQVIAAFLVRDAQAAGGSDPNTAALDPNLGVSLTDNAGCPDSADNNAALVVRFKWLDRFVHPITHAQTSTTHIANYYLSSRKLDRQTCTTSASGLKQEHLTLANNIAAILPSPPGTAVCITANLPSPCSPGLPDAVQLSVRAIRPSDLAPTTYSYTLMANVRPQGQSFTTPSGVLPFSPALLALGGCSNGTPGISVSGGAHVNIAGSVVVNGSDQGTCTAMSLSGSGSLYSAITTSIESGGTCGGGNCSQAGTIGSFPAQLLDPYAGLTPPGDCTGQQGSFSGGHYTPGVYPSLVNANSTVTFDPGIYIFCGGVSFGSQANITANGVLFYVANGAMTISGQAIASMTALGSGPYAGMLIWIPPTNTAATTLTFNGGSNVDTYDGVIYAPSTNVVVSGNGSGSGGANVGAIIALTITFSGGPNIVIGNPPSIIAPATLPDWTIGNDYGSASRPATMTTTGGTAPYTWSATGLPTGLTINASTGVIGGTPSATGTFSSIVVTVTDAQNLTATKNYSVTINPVPSITGPATLPDSTQGVAYPSTTMTASGGTAPLSWFASGLPPGMSINTSTGAIGGTPTASGTFTVTVTVADVVGVTKSKDYPLTINSPPTIGTTALPEGTQNRPYNATLTASSGTPPYTWSATGLPNGLSIAASTATTGLISGTTNKTGTFSVTVTITDSVGAPATKTYSLTINGPTSITGPASLPASTVNRSYPGVAVTATGGTSPYAWSATGLQAGLNINASTGVIAGTPTATGTSSVTVTMTDAVGATATRTYSLTINTAPSITTAGPLPNTEQGRPYSATVSAANGTTPYSWAASGMPNGLAITPSGANSAVISGTPTVSGPFSITVTVTDTAGATDTHIYTVTSYPTPSVNTTSLPGWDAKAPGYSATLAVTGGSGGYTWTKTAGTLPAGLTLSSAGVISGTPTTAGTYSGLVFKVTDSSGGTSTSGSLSIVISPQLTVTTTSPLPSATQGQTGYSKTLAQTGGLGPFTWSVQSGSLPTGLGLSTGGVISGNVDAAATTQTFTIALTDANSVTVTKPFTITVNASPTVSTNSLPAGGIGAAYSQPLAAVGGTNPFTWAITVGTLPTGLNMSTGGVISGTIGAGASTQTFTVVATDANGIATPGKSLTIVVNPAPTITSNSPTTGVRRANNVVVTITGTGFVSGATVQLIATSGTAPTITNTTWVSSTQMTITINIPNSTSTNNLKVTNPDGGSATLTGAFTVA